MGRRRAPDDGSQQPAARQRRAHRDRWAHHQGRAVALPHRDRACQWVPKSLPAGRAVDRSKLLPFGSALDADQLAQVRDAVRLALQFAAEHRALPLDPAARERWIEIYPHLSAAQPGLAGAATARAEAHVVRLALIYALLDCSATIGHEHLEAALAVWRYSADSARWIFGDSLGDPTADEIWAASKERPAGVTRTEVSDMFSRNKKRREIERALSVLEDAGRLRRETRQPVRGRTTEVWIPVLASAA